MSTITRGNAAECAVLKALVDADMPAFLPLGEGSPFDIVAVMPSDGSVVRIQVRSGRVRNNCVLFNTCSTDHGHGRRPYHGVADVFGAGYEFSRWAEATWSRTAPSTLAD